jgi:serine/threonine-protein kinase haspin
VPDYLQPLLAECGQASSGLHNFSTFISTFPFDPLVASSARTGDVGFRKIGEASYSEVFGIGDVVLKVIPLRDESQRKPRPHANVYDAEADGPFATDAKDVLKEVIVTHAMGQVCAGFVKLLRTYVVRGTYPQVLLELWDEYYERKGSEGVRPGGFFLPSYWLHEADPVKRHVHGFAGIRDHRAPERRTRPRSVYVPDQRRMEAGV